MSKEKVIFRSESAADDFLTHISAEGLEDLDYGRVSNEADIYNLLPPESVVVEFNNIPANDLTRFREVAETNRGNLTVSKTQQEPTSMFTGGHWDEPNVIAHIRFNERVDPDGNKVLFIEEIQSDWAHQGHEKGFNDYGLKDYLKSLNPGNRKIAERMLAAGKVDPSVLTSAKFRDDWTTLSKTQPELEHNIIHDTVDNSPDIRGGIPRAPFVTDTHQWTNLGLKRMIKYAADNGFDSIAWTTGKQQGERYHRLKSVGSINFKKKR